jgi:hippurate hydrolase
MMITAPDRLLADMTLWRHQLHAQPETAYEEYATADLVAGLLETWGIEVHRGLAGTGVVGTLRRGTAAGSIGLRADMDALPVTEANHVAHRSQVSGKMHACGHDGHTAMLLGAACRLAAEGGFDGTIQFIFQPAEENEAGARRMIEEGLFERFPVDAVFGMHNMPGIDAGKIVIRPGPMMASCDLFEIEVTGRGTHGGWPHQGDDLISVAAELVRGFNHIAARTIDPLATAVISPTIISGGHALNVMPASVRIAGSTRCFSVELQDHLEDRMRALCDGLAAAHGVTISLAYDRRYPPLINHVAETEAAAHAAVLAVGPANVLRDEPAVMGAEDFAWMLRARPGSYVWIGNGIGKEGGMMLHSPVYDFNDAILETGARYWVELARSWLPGK